MPAPRAFDAAQDAQLIVFVRNAEAALDADERSELTEQLGAERMDGPARDLRRRGPEAMGKPVRDLARGLVGERERSDASRVVAQLLDQKTNAFGEAVRFARARPREHEQRPRRRFDRITLCARGAPVGESFDRRRCRCRQANRRCERSFALRASSSRLRGGA